MKTLLILIFVTISSFWWVFAADLRNDLVETVQELIPSVDTEDEIDYVDLAKEAQFWLFAFVGVIAVAYIIYLGAKLIWAPGNAEEFSAAMKSLLYIIIGLALMPLAYAIVKIIVNVRIW